MKERKVPMRRCVGCMVSKEKKSLIRVTSYEDIVTIDLTGKAKGRGAYLCKDNPDCWEKAYKRKALERSLEMEITPEKKEKIFSKLKEISGGQTNE